MTPKDQFTVVIQSCGFINIFWTLKAVAAMTFMNTPSFPGTHPLKTLVVQLAMGVAVIYWAPLIASVCWPDKSTETAE